VTIAPLTDYKDRLAGLPEDEFIGSILWYSIAGTVTYVDGKRTQTPVRVTRDQLRVWFDDLGLDGEFLPPPILKVDAFRKATTKAERSYDLEDGRRAVLYVDEVESNQDFVLRHLLHKVVDPRQPDDDDKVQHTFVASLKFFRGGRLRSGRRDTDHYKTRAVPRLTGAMKAMTEELLQEIDDKYNDLAVNLNEEKIRAVLRNYLIHLNAIAVKPQGAVYFIHNTRQATLDALQELVRRVGQGCTFEQIPLVDTGDTRRMLTDAFQSEVEDDVRLLLGRIAEINEKVKGGKIKADTYAELNEAYRDLASRSEEYTRILGVTQARSAAALELALESVMNLSQRVDFKGSK
jgi:hypothetical protein